MVEYCNAIGLEIECGQVRKALENPNDGIDL